MGLKEFGVKMLKGYRQRKPGILTGLGITSMLVGTVEAVRATPKAMAAIEEKKKEEGHESLTALQTIQCCWKYYIWAMIAEGVGIGCELAALSENNRRIGGLMTAVNGLENGIREAQAYRQFVIDRLGAKKEAEIRQQATQQMVNENPPPADMQREYIDGVAPKPVCKDVEFGRYYHLDYDDAVKAINRCNNRINSSLEGYVSLNDLYAEMGVPTIEFGDRIGWSTETGLIEIPERDCLQYAGTPNGWPCWILEFTNPPQYEYKYFRKR